MYEDNASLIHLAYEDIKHLKRCKHFLMAINFFKIPSESNRADILTKESFASHFQYHADHILQGSTISPPIGHANQER